MPVLIYSPHNKTYVTWEKVRQPSTSLFTYRCLQLLNRQINQIDKHLFPALIVLLMLFSVVCNSAVLVYFRQLTIIRTIPLICAAIFSLLVQSISYYKIGLTEKASHHWITAWKHSGFNCGLSHVKRIQLHRYIKSCGPIYSKVGDWGGKIKKETGLKVIGKTLLLTMKSVLTLRKKVSY